MTRSKICELVVKAIEELQLFDMDMTDVEEMKRTLNYIMGLIDLAGMLNRELLEEEK